MATSCILILLVMVLACNSLHNNSTSGKKHAIHGYEEYATKPKGTLKTIKWKGGDLVDCVDIYKQPSMLHPLLKDHIIQLEPPLFPPISLIKHNVSRSSHVNVLGNERCPHRSIPIRRPFKDELVRATFLPSRHANRNNISEKPDDSVHKYAGFARVPNVQPSLTAVSALINVWKPTTEYTTLSLARIMVGYFSGDVVVDTVETGWMVDPYKYRDQEPRLFASYTNNGKTTRCCNIDCAGFIQISRTACFGCKIPSYSTYDGKQFDLDLKIFQDVTDGNWWIMYNDRYVGYYPTALLTKLGGKGGATNIQWGGEISQPPGVTRPTSTQMGSGHFPYEGYKRAAYFQNMLFEDATSREFKAADFELIKVVSHPQCYHISRIMGGDESKLAGSHFYYGGPGGGAPDCKV